MDSPATAPAAPSALCVTHPETLAHATCERCGAFTCERCVRVRADGVRLCAGCWPLHRFLPLPIDTSNSPLALLRTLALWLFRPRASRALYSPRGSMGRSLAMMVLAAVSTWLAAAVLGGLQRTPWWGETGAPGPVQFNSDLADWMRRYFHVHLAIALLVLGVDRLLLWRTSDTRRLLRAWAYSLTPLWTVWLAVALAWLGASQFRPVDGQPVTLSAYSPLVVPMWIGVGFLMWLTWRWWLLSWGSDSTWRARVVAVWPLLFVAIFLFLLVRVLP